MLKYNVGNTKISQSSYRKIGCLGLLTPIYNVHVHVPTCTITVCHINYVVEQKTF